MEINIVSDSDFVELHEMIKKTCEISFPPFYPESFIKETIASLNIENLKKRASFTHFYVFKDNGKIIGCGAIGPYWNSETESSLFTIFVDPDYQGKGIGRKIIETLENDYYFKRAKRIEVPAGIAALPFYKKMGYVHKNGVLTYIDGHFALEKFNNK
ncbi:MAG: GNAT family N-acetyltransferase [Erysipelotrichales bacterium]|nr:GNAT family N-acetyltransferase [Erysipelotrichales bacterium]